MGIARRLLGQLLTAGSLLFVLNGCGGGGSNPTPTVGTTGTVSGHVADAQTGTDLSGVTVQIGDLTTTTDAQGNYTLASVPKGNNVVAQFGKDQYAKNFATVDVGDGQSSIANRQLSKIAVREELNADVGGLVTLADSSAQVELPASGLVNASTGAAVTGKVWVEMTPIDPAAQEGLMPGNYRVAGEQAPIESMGALQVEIRDDKNQLLNLAPGKKATIRIPVPSGVSSPPLTIPLYFFNESTGLWVREGVATLAGTLPQQYYEGQVSHFTVWNADQPLETIYIEGCVRNNAGQAQQATIETSGVDYIGESTIQTDANGHFRIAARRDSQVRLTAMSESETSSVIITTGSGDWVEPNCLILAENPPVVDIQPADITMEGGSFRWLEVTARYAEEYQWYHNGLLVSSGSPFLIVSGGQSSAGSYYVVVRNRYGEATSTTVNVTISSALTVPVITKQPVDLAVISGADASFEVQAQGSSIRYQWFRNGQIISGANGPKLSLGTTSLGDNTAKFHCVLSNSAGDTVSDTATLSVNAAAIAPSIALQPTSATVSEGQSAIFAVMAAGTAPFQYQWLRNGVVIPNASSARYTTPILNLADTGAKYSVRVTNSKSSITSAEVTLTVNVIPSISGLYYGFYNGTAVSGLPAFMALPAAGGETVSLLPAGQGALINNFAQATVLNDSVSNVFLRYQLISKNGRLYRQDMLGSNGLTLPALVSTLDTGNLCDEASSGDTSVSEGDDYQDPSRSWAVYRKPGQDLQCGSEDDLFVAVQMNMLATDAPLNILPPVFAIHNSSGALSGWLVRNGALIQRVNPDFTAPSTLFTLPGGDLTLSDSLGELPNHWLFQSNGSLYSVDLSGNNTAPTFISLVAADESVAVLGRTDSSNVIVAITNFSASNTKVLRYNTSSKSTTAVGMFAANGELFLTPTHVVLQEFLGRVSSLAISGGAVKIIYTPANPGWSLGARVAGERVWIGSSDEVVGVNSDGSNLQTLANSQLAGCLNKASFVRYNESTLCDAIVVVQGNSLKSFDAITGAVRLTYGNVNIPSQPLVSGFFLMSLTTWGQGAVLTQVIHSTENQEIESYINYFFKSNQVGMTQIPNL